MRTLFRKGTDGRTLVSTAFLFRDGTDGRTDRRTEGVQHLMWAPIGKVAQ